MLSTKFGEHRIRQAEDPTLHLKCSRAVGFEQMGVLRIQASKFIPAFRCEFSLLQLFFRVCDKPSEILNGRNKCNAENDEKNPFASPFFSNRHHGKFDLPYFHSTRSPWLFREPGSPKMAASMSECCRFPCPRVSEDKPGLHTPGSLKDPSRGTGGHERKMSSFCSA
jgi:hypothetical protein